MKLIQDVTMGKNIQRLRVAKGLTQEQVCARMTVQGIPMTQSTYTKFETGMRGIFLSELLILQKIFAVSYDEFFRDLVPIDKRTQKPEGSNQ